MHPHILYTYIHTYIEANMNTYIRTCIYTYIKYIHICIHARTKHTFKQIHRCMHVRLHVGLMSDPGMQYWHWIWYILSRWHLNIREIWYIITDVHVRCWQRQIHCQHKEAFLCKYQWRCQQNSGLTHVREDIKEERKRMCICLWTMQCLWLVGSWKV